MARQSQIQFTIPEPCNIPWNGMTPVDKDQRHCSSCDRVITDFSKMSDDELMLYFRHANGKMCGRFLKGQLNRPLSLLPDKSEKAKWWRTWMLIPLTLFGKSVKAQNDSVPYANHPKDTNALSMQVDTSENGFGVKSASENFAQNKISVFLYDSTNRHLVSTQAVTIFADSLFWVNHPDNLYENHIQGIVPYIPYHWDIAQYLLQDGWKVVMVTPPDSSATVNPPPDAWSYPWGPNPFPGIIDWFGNPLTVQAQPKEFEKSILSVILDTIVPLRKKKIQKVVSKNNSEIVEQPKHYKEISQQPKPQPKPEEPGLPSIDPLAGILPNEKKYPWQS